MPATRGLWSTARLLVGHVAVVITAAVVACPATVGGIHVAAAAQAAALSDACGDTNVIGTCGELLNAGGTQAALQYATHVLSTLPGCVDSWQCMGALLFNVGDLHGAISHFSKAAALNPASATVRSNLALARSRAGFASAAVADYRLALQLDPSLVSVAVLLADALETNGQAEEALALLEDILRQSAAAAAAGSPVSVVDVTGARTSVARAYLSAGRQVEAGRVLLDGAADDPGLYLRYAVSQVPPIPASAAAIAKSRHTTEVLVKDVIARLQAGDVVLHPEAGVPLDRWIDPCYLLTYHGLNDEPLRRLIGRMLQLALPAATVLNPAITQTTPAAFHPPPFPAGFPSTTALRAAARALRRTPPVLPRRLHIGFLSNFLHLHSVSKMIQRLITGLPRSLFHITVLAFPGPSDFVLESIRTQADTMVLLPAFATLSGLQQAQQLVMDQQLEVLVYPELGMHRMTFLLALARLAPIQMSTHGNSETSGLPDTIDYFVSFDAIEDTHADAHFSEQLVRLPGFHSQFMPPMHLPPPTATPRHADAVHAAAPPSTDTRGVSHIDAADAHLTADVFSGTTAFQLLVRTTPPDAVARCPAFHATVAAMNSSHGVPPGAPHPPAATYLVPQTLYKFHPMFDAVLSQLLHLDGTGKVVLLEGSVQAWDERVVRRLAGQLASDAGVTIAGESVFDLDAVDSELGRPLPMSCSALATLVQLQPLLSRVVLAPQRGHNAWLEMLAAADVVVDSHPFGGCTSSYEALLMGTPVVSTPSDAMRGRFTYAMLKQAKLDHFVVPALSDLAPTAVQVASFSMAQSPVEKKDMQAEIARAMRSAGVMDDTAMHRWTELLLNTVATYWRWVADAQPDTA